MNIWGLCLEKVLDIIIFLRPNAKHNRNIKPVTIWTTITVNDRTMNDRVEASNGLSRQPKVVPNFLPVVLLFSALVIFLRLSSFFQSTVNWDESLYLIVADRWLQGYLPYTDVWDNKPPGIYLLFVIALSTLGHAVFSIRVLTCLFIIGTCYVLYITGIQFPKHGVVIGLLAGVSYSILTLNNGGMASNTEVFFMFFTSLTFYSIISSFSPDKLKSEDRLFTLRNTSMLFIVGLCLGFGFNIKYVVLFDSVAFSIILGFLFLFQIRTASYYLSIVNLLKVYGLIALGFLFPLISSVLYFTVNGEFDSYYYANFIANKARTVDISFSILPFLKSFADQIQQSPVLWVSVFAAFIFIIISRRSSQKERWLISSLLIWLSVVLLGIGLVFRGTLYPHYFLQLSPSLCLISAYIVARLMVLFNTRNTAVIKYSILGLFLSTLFYTHAFNYVLLSAKYVYFRQIKSIKYWLDTPTAVAEYIKLRIQKDDYIYVVDDEPIIYFLTGAKMPTKYIFPPFLILRIDLPNITGVHPLKEMESIIDKQPVYIVKRQSEENRYYLESNKLFFKALNGYIDEKYKLETFISSENPTSSVNLYRLITPQSS